MKPVSSAISHVQSQSMQQYIKMVKQRMGTIGHYFLNYGHTLLFTNNLRVFSNTDVIRDDEFADLLSTFVYIFFSVDQYKHGTMMTLHNWLDWTHRVIKQAAVNMFSKGSNKVQSVVCFLGWVTKYACPILDYCIVQPRYL